jgi:repressor LexA
MEDITTRFLRVYEDLIELKKVSNPSDFSKKIGISTSMMNEILKNRSKVGLKVIQNTVNNFNGYSLDWLIKGEGKMRENFKIPYLHNDPDEEWAIKTYGIPLIPVEAIAGFGSGAVQVMDYDTEKYIVPEFTELKVDFMIRVKGSSMYPKYNSGDLVACKKLTLNDYFFQWNKVYVLDTDQGALIKRIKKGKDESHLLIISDNEKYDPFDLHLSKLNAIAIVVGVIRLE